MSPPSKAQVRQRLRAARAQLSQQELDRRGELLKHVLLEVVDGARLSRAETHACAGYPEAIEGVSAEGAQAIVLGFLPMPGEPDLRPFLAAHTERGGEVWVPVVADPAARRLLWTSWSPEAELRRSRHAPVFEPTGERFSMDQLISTASAPVALLVPALAVDGKGARLGQGGGYYDALFSGSGVPGGTQSSIAAEDRGQARFFPRLTRVARLLPEAARTAVSRWHGFPGLRLGRVAADFTHEALHIWAVVHSEEILPVGSFPVEEHDLRLGRAVTEAGVVVLGGDELGGEQV
ncbi:5-formyltetrahydrofolate cyclo-ligase [Nesterenkonia ebinurensis]|uniref:5-formyltetrahydrofolate cyclo-ligase n=1 Tax=Nesterenkonia ebinurensis TaxID=2608252 RepID=UPI00168A9204|nr:5-formyltetrahydrofolate cyclo-ligase [Nesterenkonia ebinurensis]